MPSRFNAGVVAGVNENVVKEKPQYKVLKAKQRPFKCTATPFSEFLWRLFLTRKTVA